MRTGAVAPAARDDAQGRFSAGEAVGFVERGGGRLGRAARDAARGAGGARARRGRRAPELISVLAGEDAPLGARRGRARSVDGEVELELRDGGQPAYWWLLAAE